MASVPDAILDREIDVDRLVSCMTPGLKITQTPQRLEQEKENESSISSCDYSNKRQYVEEWRERMGNRATYRAFIATAEEAQMKCLAERVMAMLQEREKGN